MGALTRLRHGFGAAGPAGARRAIGVLATLVLLLLFSWPAFAAGRPSRLDKTLKARASQPGVSRVIVRSAGGDVSQKIHGFRGRTGRRVEPPAAAPLHAATSQGSDRGPST